MGCRLCPASNLLPIHFGEDGSRSVLSKHERVRTRLLSLLSVESPWILKSRVSTSYAAGLLRTGIAHRTCFLGLIRHDPLVLLVSSNLPIGHYGLIGVVGCCCLLLHQNSNASDNYLFKSNRGHGTWRLLNFGVFDLLRLCGHHSFNTDWWECVLENGCV